MFFFFFLIFSAYIAVFVVSCVKCLHNIRWNSATVISERRPLIESVTHSDVIGDDSLSTLQVWLFYAHSFVCGRLILSHVTVSKVSNLNRVWNPDYLKSGQGCHFAKNHLKFGQKHIWSYFGTHCLKTALSKCWNICHQFLQYFICNKMVVLVRLSPFSVSDWIRQD